LRQTSSVLYLAVDSLIPLKGKPLAGFDEFTAAMDHAGIPMVWVSSRTRLQLDDPRRKIGHNHPFIAEDGCGVYLPEDYFHLRPEKSVRLGRYMCIPVAEPQPAAAEALEALAEATGVDIVPLRSLSPRELVQNSGLAGREAELLRQRDFDELFFLAGASEEDIQRLRGEAQARKLLLREHGVLWSAAVGANLSRGVKELTSLYDRALRRHASSVAIAASEEAATLFPACDRRMLLGRKLAAGKPSSQPDESESAATRKGTAEEFGLRDPDLWEKLGERLAQRA
jgi:predicted mannosyl-3-phosphoglycerate phosphatase (HAD superfamily)